MRKNISKTINQTLEDRLVAQVSSGQPMAIIGKKAAEAAKQLKGKKEQKKQ